ncbi:unnamed protein product [Rhizophagus irregularis]|nr:unnamed protein product [Rhizophagus irregularis]
MSEFCSYTPHNMKEFDKKTQLDIENFKKSKEIKFDNSKFMTSIVQEIKEQIKKKDGNDMVKILEDIKNNESTNIGIKNKLTKINNDLQKYKEDIKKCPDLVDSDYITEIREEINQKNEYYKRNSIYSKTAVISGIGLLIMIAPAAGPAAVAMAATAESIVSTLGVAAITNAFISLLGHIKVDKKEESIKDKKKLNIEVEKLKEKINFLQTRRIQKTEKCQNKDAIVYKIEEKWKDVKQECQIYPQAMRDLINKEALSLE